MTLYTSDKRLTGSVPFQVRSTGKVSGLGPNGTVWHEIGQQDDGRWLYDTDRPDPMKLMREVSRLTVALAECERINAELRAQLEAGGAPPAKPAHMQRNGVSLSNSRNGYYEDVVKDIAPYVQKGGIRALRIPVRRKNLFADGKILDVIQLNGYPTAAWTDPKGVKQLGLKAIVDYCLANDVDAVIDEHGFSGYWNPELAPFWVAMGRKLMETYGDSDRIVLELSNEAGSGSWEPDYANSVRALVTAIREAGITYRLVVGWGGWNSINGHKKALAELDAIGGPQSIDPLNRLEFSVHDYPTTSGNDQPKSGEKNPEIKGGSLEAAWAEMFDEFKRRGLRIWVSEIGIGGGARGWLKNGSGSEYTGKDWFNDFAAMIARYPDTVAGVLVWGGGLAWGDDYPFKVEYAKRVWDQTTATDFWQTVTRFWRNEHLEKVANP